VALQNRVTPFGDIVATPARGAWMGNRGVLHGSDRTLSRRRWTTRAWITCRLEFKDRHRRVMTPGRYTELFFLDEATALAAGHRPCGECRRHDFDRFRALWAAVHEPVAGIAALDRALHAARLDERGAKRTYAWDVDQLPDGVLVTLADRPSSAFLVCQGALWPWSAAGYGAPFRWTGTVLVLTPRPVVAVIAAGYRPQIDGLAGQARAARG